MKRYPSVKRNCENCGVDFLAWQSRINIGKGRFCSTRCGRMGSNNPAWKGGVRMAQGYRHILVPDHPHANGKGYVAEHRLVMEKRLNRYLTPEEVIHHINRVRDDNRIENLQLMANQSEHYALHMTNNKIWVGKKHKPETIEKMKKSWAANREHRLELMRKYTFKARWGQAQ